MKLALLILTGFTMTQSYAGGLPDGNFNGKGLWKSATDQGTYEVRNQINGPLFSAYYQFPDGTEKDWIFEMEQTTNGFFNVKAFGTKVGTGYCLEYVELCHYEISVGTFVLEETLTHTSDKLYRYGSKIDSKNESAGRIMWQESLDKN